MSTNAINILLRHNFISMPETLEVFGVREANTEALATVLMNLSYYGKALSKEAYTKLVQLTPSQLINWWGPVEEQLKSISGEDRKIGDFVVYKNFPKEVLDKTAAEYWIPQILMYWGFPNEMFTTPTLPREKMAEQPKCTVLHLSKENTLQNVLNSYLAAPARWKDHELADVLYLTDWFSVDLSKLAFKENMVLLTVKLLETGKKIKIKTATDVLRLAVGLSDGDVSLREKSKFKSFKKKERRFLLDILETCNNLDEDAARRPEMFKRLMHQLHAGDWKNAYPRAVKMMNSLYKDELVTFNSQIEQGLRTKDVKVLELLSTRPGDFRRRLVHVVNIFGKKAVEAFGDDKVLSKLTVGQLVSTRSFLSTCNERKNRIFPPKGNWALAKLGAARPMAKTHLKKLDKVLGTALGSRVPTIGLLDHKTSMIKLPNNGEEGQFTRGSIFQIPKEMKFIRTASYWKISSHSYVWFDNGWNFFDKDWKNNGACSWSTPKFPHVGYFNSDKQDTSKIGAVFSGDPTNTKESQGRACQMIDLYPEQLRAQGVRYAVWSILCYSGIPFSKAEDVFAALQWGENPETGKLFEPSRCQINMPLKGEQLTKFVVLIDLETMQMQYLDANLKGSTSSATHNGKLLEKIMPPFVEHINALPSVYDLFKESVKSSSKKEEFEKQTKVLYSDKSFILNGERAYVFKSENKDNKFVPVDINGILA